MSEIYVCKLPPEVQKFALENLNENEENRRNGLEEIKHWASENPEYHIRSEDRYILPFLRACKYDVKKTIEKMKNSNIIRRDRPEWFNDRNVNKPELQHLAKMGVCVVLKKLYNNRMILVIRPTVYDPKINNLDEVIKIGSMVCDIAMFEQEYAQIYGVITIIDLTNVGFEHAKHFYSSGIGRIANNFQNYHFRPQIIQFINAPTFVNAVLNIFKGFMTSKMKKRVNISTEGDLTQCIDKSVLPIDYGGDEESLDALGNYWLQKLLSHAEWFSEYDQYKADQF